MTDKKKTTGEGRILKTVSVILAAAGILTAWAWWQMPYLHNNWYDHDLTIILHIITFALCPAACVMTFLFADRDRRVCTGCGIAVLALAVASTLTNTGFVPYVGTFLIGLFAVMYLIALFMVSRPEKPESLRAEELADKYRFSKNVSKVFAVLTAFSVLFPKGGMASGQHMGTDGSPGVIEYYFQYSEFGIFLISMIPVFLILLIIFVTRTVLLKDRLRKLEEQ